MTHSTTAPAHEWPGAGAVVPPHRTLCVTCEQPVPILSTERDWSAMIICGRCTDRALQANQYAVRLDPRKPVKRGNNDRK